MEALGGDEALVGVLHECGHLVSLSLMPAQALRQAVLSLQGWVGELCLRGTVVGWVLS